MKEGLEFADYTFEEHLGKNIALYQPRAVLHDYIKGRVEKAGIRDLIRFRNLVRRVEYDDSSGKFQIVAQDILNDRETDETFDHLVVASGHLSTPNVGSTDESP